MSSVEFQLRISRILEKFDNPMMRLETITTGRTLNEPDYYLLTIGNLGKSKKNFTGENIEELLDKAELQLLMTATVSKYF